MHEAASRASFVAAVGDLSPGLLTARGWRIHGCEYPVLDIEFLPRVAGEHSLRIQMECTSWPEVPPSVRLCDADGTPKRKISGGGIFNDGPHGNTGLPFVCMAGTREYHTHPSHIADSWDNYRHRDAYTLGGIGTQIWNGWLTKKI